MWKKELTTFYTYLQSQQTAQRFLYHCYRDMKEVDAETKSYENCNAFMYYLEHGLKFFESGKKLDLFVKPILYFYGMVHLVKACLLTKRPNYPESTTILAHGVSSRKRKKRDYTFMDDEVKLQYNGLFPYLSNHLFSKDTLPFERVKMNYLLSFIPEMTDLFTFHKEEKLVEVGIIGSVILQFPNSLLDNYHLTANAFLHRIAPLLPEIKNTDLKGNIQIELAEPLDNSYGPFLFHTKKQSIYFPKQRSYFLSLPEVMVHYLLLYNLSMLSRYETEWWGELSATKPDIDFPFISLFLDLTVEKVPLLLGNELYRMVKR